MEMKDLMSTTPESLAAAQHKALEEFVRDKLEYMLHLIKTREYPRAKNLLGLSPAGDGTGCDNHYICFADILGEGADMETVLTRLATLEAIIK